jgi:hypothetical protein
MVTPEVVVVSMAITVATAHDPRFSIPDRFRAEVFRHFRRVPDAALG